MDTDLAMPPKRLLYRGVNEHLDRLNDGQLRPKGNRIEINMTRADGDLGMKRDGKFSRGRTEDNAARGHQLQSGLHDGCFLSFTRSLQVAIHFATNNNTKKGFVYIVDEDRLAIFGVLAKEYSEQTHPEEMEVSLRASDGGDLSMQIVVEKILAG